MVPGKSRLGSTGCGYLMRRYLRSVGFVRQTGFALGTSVLIVGSGPAAAGAAIACAQRTDVTIRILDVGARLEPHREEARERLGFVPPEAWHPVDVAEVTALPVDTESKGPPQKRSFGSDYPFRNTGQRDSVVALGGANDAVISGAYGGFSTVWGAQVMPFPRTAFRGWPVTADEMYDHYRAILASIPYSAESDDLAALFPLLGQPQPLPQTSERTQSVLDRYNRHRQHLNKRGILIGHARLALESDKCVRCGLCMTGCPYLLIYSAAHTFETLRRTARAEYLSGHLAIGVEERSGRATVITRTLGTGELCRFDADLVFLAAGAFGTTRIIGASQELYDRPISMLESAQFILPFFSLNPTEHDPRDQRDFSLNQFNAAMTLDPEGFDIPQLHFYTYDRAFDDRLPRLFKNSWGMRLTPALLRRLSVAFGYLPSWGSPHLTAHLRRPDAGALPALTVSGSQMSFFKNRMLRAVISRLLYAAPYLDLLPMLPLLRVSAPAKSYHCGGSFPHTASDMRTQMSSDPLGRVGGWSRIHAIDGSVLPTIAANTFTLTVMANAHRIAASSLGEHD